MGCRLIFRRLRALPEVISPGVGCAPGRPCQAGCLLPHARARPGGRSSSSGGGFTLGGLGQGRQRGWPLLSFQDGRAHPSNISRCHAAGFHVCRKNPLFTVCRLGCSWFTSVGARPGCRIKSSSCLSVFPKCPVACSGPLSWSSIPQTDQ